MGLDSAPQLSCSSAPPAPTGEPVPPACLKVTGGCLFNC